MAELHATNDCVVELRVADQDVVRRRGEAITRQPTAAGGVTLRVGIDEEDALFGNCERRCEIDGSGRLADPAFLIGNSENAAHRQRRCGEGEERVERRDAKYTGGGAPSPCHRSPNRCFT